MADALSTKNPRGPVPASLYLIGVLVLAAAVPAAKIAVPLILPHWLQAERIGERGRPAGISSETVSQERLAHVPGKTITVEIVELAPGAVVPEHHHAGSVSVYVLSGYLRSQLDAGPIIDYGRGETFFEAPGTVHTLAANPSATEPVRFMAIHIADDGAQLTTYH